MKHARFWKTSGKYLLQVIAYRWIFSLIDLCKRALEAWRKFCEFLKLPHPKQEELADCTVVNTPSFHRPDPCIYSQDYLLKLGLAVTWDNPDIVLRKGGVIVTEHDLLPATEYEIDATVWNNSYDAPAFGLKVLFSFLSFGVATVETAIGQTFVNLGVKGGVNHPANARMKWKTPPSAGHFCLKVVLSWIDDANPGNNVGQNNLNVVAPQSPAEFTFRLRNAADREEKFGFEVDTYAIPNAPSCPARLEQADKQRFSERLKKIQAVHDKANFPVPADWKVEISPDQPLLDPDEEIDVNVKITPPGGFAGSKPFNVNARQGDKYAGGVTLIVSTEL